MKKSLSYILLLGFSISSCSFEKEGLMISGSLPDFNNESLIERAASDSMVYGNFSQDRYDVSCSMMIDYIGLAMPEKEISSIEPFLKEEKT
ncbi:MAG: hypothetical protein IJV54_07265, partial [Bacteroidales bacterium]|nr:hypothetical protein [Bacteroidales bacterium]